MSGYWHETDNLALDDDGILYLKAKGEDNERLGDVPDHLLGEHAILLDEWWGADSASSLHAEWTADYYANLLPAR